MTPQVERYDGLRAKAVVVNSGTNCVVRIRPVWSEYLGAVLMATMYLVTIVGFSVAFNVTSGGRSLFEWSVIIFVTAMVIFAFWAGFGRIMITEISASRSEIIVRRSLFGVARTRKIMSGAIENVCWHAAKDLTGWPWHSFIHVVLPSGKEISLINELEVMDERFAPSVMELLSDVTGWQSDVKRIYMEPPRSSGESGP